MTVFFEYKGWNFEWDSEKDATNIQKHGVSFSEAATFFRDGESRIDPDFKHSIGEERWVCLGLDNEKRVLAVVATWRETETGTTSYRIISAREISTKKVSQFIKRLEKREIKVPSAPKISLLWWVIPGALAGMPMPFIHPERRLNGGGPLTAYEDELQVLYTAGIRAVVSLLNIPSDAAVYQSAGFAFLCLPVPDGGAPTMEQSQEFICFVDRQLGDRRPVAVHCEAGLGRTGTILAAYLMLKGQPFESAVACIRAAEKSAIETPQQVQFLRQLT